MIVFRRFAVASTLLKQAQELPADTWRAAALAKTLYEDNVKDPAVWQELQRKTIQGGFVYEPMVSFLYYHYKLRIPLAPEFDRELQSLINNCLLSTRNTLKLLRAYALIGAKDDFLASFNLRMGDLWMIYREDFLRDMYVVFWKVGSPTIKRAIEREVTKEKCDPNAVFKIYYYSVEFGDTKFANLLSNFGDKIKALNSRNFLEFGGLIRTTENYARYKEKWIEAIPSQLSLAKLDESLQIAKLAMEISGGALDEAAENALGMRIQKNVGSNKLHENILLLGDLKGISMKCATELVQIVKEQLKKMHDYDMDEATNCEALLQEVWSEDDRK